MEALSVICKYYPHPPQLCIILNIWILTTKTILVLAACSLGSDEDVASGTDTHLDITFGLQAVESSSLVSVLFREAFSHHYISFFHLLVNGFSVTSFRTFFKDPYHPYIGGRGNGVS